MWSVKLGILVVLSGLVPEVFLSWHFAWRDGRGASGESEVGEDFHHNFLFDDSRDGSHIAAALVTVTHVEGEDS